MYRFLLAILYLSVASSAPQIPGDSDVTFVKIQPVVEDIAPTVPASRRESRIENLPLTIPGNIASDSNLTDKRQIDSDLTDKSQTDSDLTDKRQSDSQSKESTDNEQNLPVSETLAESENLSDTLETAQTRQGKRFDSDETTESFEVATEKHEDITEKAILPPKQRKFVSKLGFVKQTYNRYSTNAIDKTGLRRFRSNCRCEKIWNCPKLQISVPRCPDEYFLCCF